MTGWELIAALRRLPSDALDQPVVFETAINFNNELETKSVIVDNVQPWSTIEDADGNFIKLS